MILFAIETCCRNIDVKITRLPNTFAWLSQMLNASCWLPLGWDEYSRYNIELLEYKYFTYNIVPSVEDVIGIW